MVRNGSLISILVILVLNASLFAGISGCSKEVNKAKVGAAVWEGFMLASSAKSAVAEYYTGKKKMPNTNADAGMLDGKMIRGSAIKSVNILKDGVVIFHFKDQLKNEIKILESKYVTQTPQLVNGVIKKWKCGGNVEKEYLPEMCKL